MTNHDQFDAAFARMPLIAILRGIRPADAAAIGAALVDAGFAIIEVPLNSPQPLDSIARLVDAVGERATVGAGTVLRVEDVAAVEAAGGTLVIAPNANPEVIREAVARGLVALPGVLTPTEAFSAIEAGAAALKLFPAEAVRPSVLKAMRTVLGAQVRIIPVGGIAPDLLAPWLGAGAAGFGLGSALYMPGMTAAEVAARARRFVAAWEVARAA